jgi:hypothetical protein
LDGAGRGSASKKKHGALPVQPEEIFQTSQLIPARLRGGGHVLIMGGVSEKIPNLVFRHLQSFEGYPPEAFGLKIQVPEALGIQLVLQIVKKESEHNRQGKDSAEEEKERNPVGKTDPAETVKYFHAPPA